MSQDITIPSSHVKYLVPAYRQRINAIDAMIKELAAERNELESVIAKYSSKEGNASSHNEIQAVTIHTDGYKSNWTWFAKAEFILKASGKPMSTSEIVEQMINYEPLLDRRKALSSMSATLAVKTTSGKIKRIINNGADQTYELIT